MERPARGDIRTAARLLGASVLAAAGLLGLGCPTVPRPASGGGPGAAGPAPVQLAPAECEQLLPQLRTAAKRFRLLGEVEQAGRATLHRAQGKRFGSWADQLSEALDRTGTAGGAAALTGELRQIYVSLADGLAGVAAAVDSNDPDAIDGGLNLVHTELVRADQLLGRGAAACGESVSELSAPAPLVTLRTEQIAQVKQTVDAAAVELQACRDEAKKRDPEMAGYLILAFEIEPDGRVLWSGDVSEEAGDLPLLTADFSPGDGVPAIGDPELIDCLLAVLEARAFSPHTGGVRRLGYPLQIPKPAPAEPPPD